jgi:hypothetical protein
MGSVASCRHAVSSEAALRGLTPTSLVYCLKTFPMPHGSTTEGGHDGHRPQCLTLPSTCAIACTTVHANSTPTQQRLVKAAYTGKPATGKPIRRSIPRSNTLLQAHTAPAHTFSASLVPAPGMSLCGGCKEHTCAPAHFLIYAVPAQATPLAGEPAESNCSSVTIQHASTKQRRTSPKATTMWH